MKTFGIFVEQIFCPATAASNSLILGVATIIGPRREKPVLAVSNQGLVPVFCFVFFSHRKFSYTIQGNNNKCADQALPQGGEGGGYSHYLLLRMIGRSLYSLPQIYQEYQTYKNN